MYLGRIVELGEAVELMEHPEHPYTKALISAIPVPNPQRERNRQRIVLEGDPPSPMFREGAPERERAELREVRPNHWAADAAAFLADRRPRAVRAG